MYLDGHFYYEISYAINYASCYMLCPKTLHELSIKVFYRYLKAKRYIWLVIYPYPELKIYCYTDADFSGMYGNEKATDT